jgi:hypothetical protein
MARSSYIYIVTDDAGKGVLKAFTVKREAIAWLSKQPEWLQEAVNLERHYDGGSYAGRKNDRVVYLDWRAEL